LQAIGTGGLGGSPRHAGRRAANDAYRQSHDEVLVKESHCLLARQANQRLIEVLRDLPSLVVDRAVELVGDDEVEGSMGIARLKLMGSGRRWSISRERGLTARRVSDRGPRPRALKIGAESSRCTTSRLDHRSERGCSGTRSNRPDVLPDADHLLTGRGVRQWCESVGGSFFDPMQVNGDVWNHWASRLAYLPPINLTETPLDLYTRAATPSKRRAHQRIVDGLLSVANQNTTPNSTAVRAELANLG
jgi:hypothetical protein